MAESEAILSSSRMSVIVTAPVPFKDAMVVKPVTSKVVVNSAAVLESFNVELPPFPSDTKRKVPSIPEFALETWIKSPYVSFGARPVKVAILDYSSTSINYIC